MSQNNSLKEQLDRWDTLDQFDRNVLQNTILLQNQLSREGMEIYRLAVERGIV